MLDPNGGDGKIGSVTVMDSTFSGVQKAIVISPPSSKTDTGTTGLVLNNVALKGVGAAVVDSAGKTILGGGANVDHWVLGPVYNGTQRTWMHDKVKYRPRDITLINIKSANGLPNPPYFERPREQYLTNSASDFVHLKGGDIKGTLPPSLTKPILLRHSILEIN